MSNLLVATAEVEALELIMAACPGCGRVIVSVWPGHYDEDSDLFHRESKGYTLWPSTTSRLPVPSEVPTHIASDYNEAAAVLPYSSKASAALSRRCLQALLRDKGYHQHDLAHQIDVVLSSLPTYIAENVDHIRNIGNFAAHPMKSQASGEIVEVELGEAEWNLDVLDELFDFFYVQPAVAQRKRDALNAKLQAAGKPPMK